MGDGDGRLRIGEILGMVIISIAVNTLRRIALAMTNPFGDDETDYELDFDLRRLWREAEETMARMPDDEEVEQREQALEAQRHERHGRHERHERHERQEQPRSAQRHAASCEEQAYASAARATSKMATSRRTAKPPIRRVAAVTVAHRL